MDHTLYALATEEIPLVIEKASIFGGRIAQPSSRTNAATIIDRIDVDQSGLLYLKLREEIPLEKSRPVTIRLNYRNVSFCISSNDYSIEGQTLIGHLPKAAKAIAIRDTERYVFPLDAHISGYLQRVEKRGGSLETDIRLVDVSKSGLGIILPSYEQDSLLQNDHIWIRKLDETEFQKPIFGRVIYSFERKYKDTSELKCGLSLDKEIPEELFLQLQQKCRLVLKA